jgi:hypothetical protein
METNWLDIEDMPLYAAVKAGEALRRLRANPSDAETAISEPLESLDRTASILTFRVRFDPPTTGRSSDPSSRIDELQFRKAN